ncbi:hypothetical protein Tco_0210328 [Tanacetum coccineum]
MGGYSEVEDLMEADASGEARRKSFQMPRKLRSSIISNRSAIEDSKSVGRLAHGLNRLLKLVCHTTTVHIHQQSSPVQFIFGNGFVLRDFCGSG